jgi:hypothetical protein
MTEFLYIAEDSRPLAERWLGECPASEQVCLVAGTEAMEAAEQLRRRFAQVSAVYGEADENLPGVLATLDKPRITVPLSCDSRPMHFRVQIQMPDLTPHYALFRALWRRGFREVAWYHLGGSRKLELPHLLDEFTGAHQGQRCFVAGNGPSLNAIDMKRLAGEITLGSNQCYLGYEQWGFKFTYWGVYDQYQIQEYGPEYEARVPASGVKFFPFEYLPWLRFTEACPVNIAWPRKAEREFSAEPDQVYRGHTVTYMLLQIAAAMGCNPIILIGADHRYPLARRLVFSKSLRRARRQITRYLRDYPVYDVTRAAHEAWLKYQARRGTRSPAGCWDAGDAAAPTHFHAQYAEPGKRRFAPPEPEESERDFDCAQRWAAAHGVQILNATPGSALNSFPRIDYDALF